MSIYNSLKDIYNSIQDEESREIFKQRAMFSLTNDQLYMNEIIKNVSERQLLRSSSKDAYIFGCGFYGKLVHDYIKRRWIGFVDNNPRGGVLWAGGYFT